MDFGSLNFWWADEILYIKCENKKFFKPADTSQQILSLLFNTVYCCKI